MLQALRTIVFALLLTPLVALASAIDINAADVAALEQIKGVGPAKAAAIVKYRDDNGPFKSVDELVNVPGIGEKSLEQMKPQITASQPKAAAAR